MSSTLLLLLAAAAGPAQAAPGPRWIDTCDFVRFQLPPGFEHAAVTEGGVRKHNARSKNAVVSVGAMEAPNGLECESAEVREKGMAPVRLARGGVACELVGAADDGSAALAMVMLPLPSGRAAVVTAISTSKDRARSAARAVAETVQPSRGPRPDPRLVGCFDYSVSSSAGSSWAGGNTVRCLRSDGSLTQRTDVDVSTSGADASTSGHGDGTDSGAWCYDGGVLTLAFEEQRPMREVIELGQRGYIAGNRVWIRRGD